MPRPTTILTLALFVGVFCTFMPMATSEAGQHAAWADDDDDDDGGSYDDDDDDDDDDDGLRQRRAATTVPRAPAPPPPGFAANEIVALALTEGDLATLTAQGFSVIEEVEVPGIAVTSRRLGIPGNISLSEARDTVRALASGQEADFNHYYRSEEGFPEECSGAECPARRAIGWPRIPDRETACARTVTIGMIDTGINEQHETFASARLDVIRLARSDLDPSRAVHGTAVAALLVGDPMTRSPGLVPGSQLIAVDAFHRVGSDERSDAFTLIEALGLLSEAQVDIINLSLAGPPNTVLEELIDRLVFDFDIVIVSAVGNLGPNAQPAYPAAYDPVVAVTAVDRDGAVYRRAVQGTHVDLAAPGVNVWTAASVSGARWKTGTSFAVPFVTAAAAILRELRPELTAREIEAELRQRAQDRGEPGPDSVFGAGLLSIEGLCENQS